MAKLLLSDATGAVWAPDRYADPYTHFLDAVQAWPSLLT